jgi:starch-binding outer membrane protein, SusD/RagB family
MIARNHLKIGSTHIVILILLTILLGGCKKAVEVDPPITGTTGEAVFSDDQTSIAAVTGLYAEISSSSLNSSNGLLMISKKAGLSADEFQLWVGAAENDRSYYENNLGNSYNIGGNSFSAGYELWSSCYSIIFKCNTAVEGLNASNSLTPEVKRQLLGECKFLRALCYFYLVNFYGDCPVAVTSDYQINRLLNKSPASQVYQQILNDLQEAKSLLSDVFVDGTLMAITENRIRPTRWAAQALLARVYLYTNDYGNAEVEASSLIGRTEIFSLATLQKAFLANNSEAIWQLQPVNMNGTDFWNTEEAKLFVLNKDPVGLNIDKTVYLNPALMSSFEAIDGRLINWIDSFSDGNKVYYFPNKYKIAEPTGSLSEYSTVLRLSEQYLIRSEARTYLNNISGAQEDLNIIRVRAGLNETSISDQDGLLSAILRERRVELFSEWGHRWLDLKRTDKIDHVMSNATPLKANGNPWRLYQQWYPIPLADIQRDPNLKQNEGY